MSCFDDECRPTRTWATYLTTARVSLTCISIWMASKRRGTHRKPLESHSRLINSGVNVSEQEPVYELVG